MKRLPVAAFAALVVATVAAFFIAQHLKVTTPFLQGSPAPKPRAFDPLYGFSGRGAPEPKACWLKPKGKRLQAVDYRRTETTFYLQHEAGHVAVYVVDTDGNIVRTITSDYDFPRTYRRNPASAFAWNGKEDDGRLAPDGTYYYRVVLIGKGRTVQIGPMQVITRPPHPKVLSAAGETATGKPVAGHAVITPAAPDTAAVPGTTTPTTPAATTSATSTSTAATPATAAVATQARVTFDDDGGAHDQVVIFRASAAGRLARVFSFGVNSRAKSATWNGLIHGKPAPAGTYLIGFQAIDGACNVGITPASSVVTHGVGVTVRYLTAQVPNAPVTAGTDAHVTVDAGGHQYFWALHRAGSGAVIEHGSGQTAALAVRMPSAHPGLYELAIRSFGHRTAVPIATVSHGAKQRSVLVVLPSLTWQALNPVDDNGDGIPDTLATEPRVSLDRPLIEPPAGFGDVAALLSELDTASFHYDLTTDLALAASPTTGLAGYRGVVFAGNETWLPSALATALKAWVSKGGHVLTVGTSTMRRTVTVSGSEASNPSPAAATDIFGARHAALITGNTLPVLPYGSDSLGLFSTSAQDFAGIASFGPIVPPSGSRPSTAGISGQQAAIAGFHVGSGVVVEVGLDDFGVRVAHQLPLRAVLARIWRLLGS